MLRGIKGSIKIKDKRAIYSAASLESHRLITANRNIIESNVRRKVSSLIYTSLSNSQTVQSLLSGTLRDDFGLFGNTVQVTLNNIIAYISNNIHLNISPAKRDRSLFTISLELLKSSDMENIISLPMGAFPSKRGEVHWLEWLVTKGTQVVLGDYFIYPYAKGKTRSGGTKVMQKLVSSSGKPFRVDPQYAGTLNDNFIRTAVFDVEDEILNAISLEIQRIAV